MAAAAWDGETPDHLWIGHRDEPNQVLRMALHDHLTHAQIATRLGLSVDTVESYVRRSLLQLRERLEALTDAH